MRAGQLQQNKVAKSGKFFLFAALTTFSAAGLAQMNQESLGSFWPDGTATADEHAVGQQSQQVLSQSAQTAAAQNEQDKQGQSQANTTAASASSDEANNENELDKLHALENRFGNVNNQANTATADQQEAKGKTLVPDDTLRAAFAKTLGVSGDDLTADLLAKVQSLQIDSGRISSFAGLHYAQNLESLTILGPTQTSNQDQQNIASYDQQPAADHYHAASGTADLSGAQSQADAAELGQLSKLKFIQMTGLGLTDTNLLKQQIQNNPQLQSVYLNQNQIRDWGAFAGQSLPGLKILNLAGNQVTNLAAVQTMSLPSLTALDISQNQIQDLSPVTAASLTSLKYLAANHNQLTDVSTLKESGLKQLAFLDLRDNHLTNLQALSGLYARYPALRTLKLDHNRLQDLSFMDGYHLNGDTSAVDQQAQQTVKMVKPQSNDQQNVAIPLPIKTSLLFNSRGYYQAYADTTGDSLAISDLSNDVVGLQLYDGSYLPASGKLDGDNYDVQSLVVAASAKEQPQKLTFRWLGADGRFRGAQEMDLNWVDPVQPVINADDRTVALQTTFHPKDLVTAHDLQNDGQAAVDLTDKIEVIDNQVNTNAIGSYPVVYKVTNQYGLSTEKKVMVTVADPKMQPHCYCVCEPAPTNANGQNGTNNNSNNAGNNGVTVNTGSGNNAGSSNNNNNQNNAGNNGVTVNTNPGTDNGGMTNTNNNSNNAGNNGVTVNTGADNNAGSSNNNNNENSAGNNGVTVNTNPSTGKGGTTNTNNNSNSAGNNGVTVNTNPGTGNGGTTNINNNSNSAGNNGVTVNTGSGNSAGSSNNNNNENSAGNNGVTVNTGSGNSAGSSNNNNNENSAGNNGVTVNTNPSTGNGGTTNTNNSNSAGNNGVTVNTGAGNSAGSSNNNNNENSAGNNGVTVNTGSGNSAGSNNNNNNQNSAGNNGVTVNTNPGTGNDSTTDTNNNGAGNAGATSSNNNQNSAGDNGVTVNTDSGNNAGGGNSDNNQNGASNHGVTANTNPTTGHGGVTSTTNNSNDAGSTAGSSNNNQNNADDNGVAGNTNPSIDNAGSTNTNNNSNDAGNNGVTANTGSGNGNDSSNSNKNQGTAGSDSNNDQNGTSTPTDNNGNSHQDAVNNNQNSAANGGVAVHANQNIAAGSGQSNSNADSSDDNNHANGSMNAAANHTNDQSPATDNQDQRGKHLATTHPNAAADHDGHSTDAQSAQQNHQNGVGNIDVKGDKNRQQATNPTDQEGVSGQPQDNQKQTAHQTDAGQSAAGHSNQGMAGNPGAQTDSQSDRPVQPKSTVYSDQSQLSNGNGGTNVHTKPTADQTSDYRKTASANTAQFNDKESERMGVPVGSKESDLQFGQQPSWQQAFTNAAANQNRQQAIPASWPSGRSMTNDAAVNEVTNLSRIAKRKQAELPATGAESERRTEKFATTGVFASSTMALSLWFLAAKKRKDEEA
ncbi:leucine-rich repeat domain-containing protein [Leuconostocaceae bacterium ESL0958]|nr:leucine-rich repeat domain-containing protein [Leuconostocaceae bacterium ESL0958]